eukprot:163434_1
MSFLSVPVVICLLIIKAKSDYNSFVCAENGLIQQIDHVLIGSTSSSSENIENVYDLLATNLSLPIVWNYQNYGGQYKGGLSLGNVHFEFIYSPPNGINGMAFEPCNTDLVIIRSQFYNKNIIKNITEDVTFSTVIEDQNYFTFGLNNIVNYFDKTSSTFFVCNYLFNENLRKQYLWKQLLSAKGGLLGIQYAESVVINVSISNNGRDVLLQNWRNVLLPYKFECNSNNSECKINNFGGGPDLILRIDVNNDGKSYQQVDMIVIKVIDINIALSVLKQMNLYSNNVLPPPFGNCVEMSFDYYKVETITKLVLC